MRYSSFLRVLVASSAIGWAQAVFIPGATAAAPDVASIAAELDPVLLVRAPDIAALTTALRGSEPGHRIVSDPLPSSALKLLTATVDFGAQYLAGSSGVELTAILPREYVFAVFALPDNANDLAVPDQVLLGKLADDRFPNVWRRRLFPVLRGMKNDGHWTETKAGQTVIYQFQKPGETPLCLAFADRLLLLGSPGGVRRVLDRSRAPAVTGVSKFGFDRLGEDRIAEIFFDAGTTIGRALKELPPDSKEARQTRLFGSDGLKRIVGAAVAVDDRFEERFLLDATAEGGFQGILGLFQHTRPVALRGATLVPARSLGYVALDLGSGEALLDGIRELTVQQQGDQGDATVSAFLQMLGVQFGVDMVQDVFGNIGAEIFAAVWSRAPKGFQWKGGKAEIRSQMTGVVGLQVKNVEAAQQTLARVLKSPVFVAFGLSSTVEKHNGVPLHLVTLSQFPGNKHGPTTIAYALVDSFLLISDVSGIKSAIDARANKKVLAQAAPFLATVDGDLAPALLRLYADPRSVLSQLAPMLAGKMPPPAKPLAPTIIAAMRSVGAARLDVLPAQTGLAVAANMPLPVLSVILGGAAADHVAKPPVQRREKLARERMKNVAKALRRYYRKNNGAPPDSLLQLAPGVLEEVPGDPFNGDGMFGYAVVPGGAGWVLTSVGPDGHADVDVDAFQSEQWQKIQRAKTPDDINTAKALIYRFRPKQFADERPLDDEGDIVRTGTW